ncbi:MAG: hypothetical protein H0U12_03280 [Thermoleophilaceae bacterium]|jgi:hypothetical protein|nr:hypothetical protein [Thermoleophilaceae bacterium]
MPIPARRHSRPLELSSTTSAFKESSSHLRTPGEHEPKITGDFGRSDPSAASAPLRDTAANTVEVGEEIRQLQALAQLRAAGILTDEEVTDLKWRVLLGRPDGRSQGRHTGVTEARHAGDPMVRRKEKQQTPSTKNSSRPT